MQSLTRGFLNLGIASLAVGGVLGISVMFGTIDVISILGLTLVGVWFLGTLIAAAATSVLGSIS